MRLPFRVTLKERASGKSATGERNRKLSAATTVGTIPADLKPRDQFNYERSLADGIVATATHVMRTTLNDNINGSGRGISPGDIVYWDARGRTFTVEGEPVRPDELDRYILVGLKEVTS